MGIRLFCAALLATWCGSAVRAEDGFGGGSSLAWQNGAWVFQGQVNYGTGQGTTMVQGARSAGRL